MKTRVQFSPIFLGCLMLAAGGCSKFLQKSTQPSGSITGEGASVWNCVANADGSYSGWCAVEEVLKESVLGVAPDVPFPGALTNYSFQVYTVDANAEPKLEYSQSYGKVQDVNGNTVPASPETEIKVASASKLVTSATVLHTVQILQDTQGAQSALSLDTTAAMLGCKNLSAAASAITLRQLLNQVSGLDKGDPFCLTELFPSTVSLTGGIRACACSALENNVLLPVGGQFTYSASNFLVAGAMAERALEVTGIKDIDGNPYTYFTWFDHVLDELGIAKSDATYFKLSADGAVLRNSDIAASLAITVPAYAKFLVPFVDNATAGRLGNLQFISPALRSEFDKPNPSTIPINYSPFTSFTQYPSSGKQPFAFNMSYGLGNWVECWNDWPALSNWPFGDYSFLTLDYSTCTKKVSHSEGKNGYMPWISTGANIQPRISILATIATPPPGSDPSLRISQGSFDVRMMVEPLLDSILCDSSSGTAACSDASIFPSAGKLPVTSSGTSQSGGETSSQGGTTSAAPPPPPVYPALGFYSVNGHFFYSNGVDALCSIPGKKTLYLLGGNKDLSNVTVLASYPPGLDHHTPCAVPAK